MWIVIKQLDFNLDLEFENMKFGLETFEWQMVDLPHCIYDLHALKFIIKTLK